MRLLFAISMLCFCSVLLIALSVARRVRRSQKNRSRPARRTSVAEFFEAGEYRTPRPMRLNQEALRESIRNNHWRTDAESMARMPAPAKVVPDLRRQPIPPVRAVQPSADREVTLEATAHGPKLQLVTTKETPSERKSDTPRKMADQRKPPQPARSSGLRRVDLSQYNKESGDLTDPYTHHPHRLRGSGAERFSKNG